MPYFIRRSVDEAMAVPHQTAPQHDDTPAAIRLWRGFPDIPDPASLVPTQITILEEREQGLPDVFGPRDGSWCVSDTIREAVETVEPGVHHFFPLEIVGQATDMPYWFMIVTTAIDAYDYEATSFQRKHGVAAASRAGFGPDVVWGDDDPCVLRKEVFGSNHLWRGCFPDGEIIEDFNARNRFFCSDALGERLLAAQVTGIDLFRCSAA